MRAPRAGRPASLQAVSFRVASLALVVALAFALPLDALAQTGAEATTAPSARGIDSYTMLGRMFNEIHTGTQRIAANQWAIGTARRIAWSLWLLVLVWSVLRSWILGRGFASLLADLMGPTVMLGLALAAMNADLGYRISSTVALIAYQYSGGASANGLAIMSNLAQVAMSVFDLKPSEDPSLWEPYGWFVLGVGFLAKLCSALILLVCAALAAGVFLMADVAIALATGLGPLLYVWAIWKPMDFLFAAWLKFLLAAAMQKLVITMMATLLGGVMSQIGTMAPELRNHTADFVAYSGLLLIAMLCAFLILQAPAMAARLVAGSGGLGLAGWSTPGAAALGGGAAATTAAGSAAAATISVLQEHSRAAAAGYRSAMGPAPATAAGARPPGTP